MIAVIVGIAAVAAGYLAYEQARLQEIEEYNRLPACNRGIGGTKLHECLQKLFPPGTPFQNLQAFLENQKFVMQEKAKGEFWFLYECKCLANYKAMIYGKYDEQDKILEVNASRP